MTFNEDQEATELLSYEDEPQVLFVREAGCAGSLIPDKQPPARLATTKTYGDRRYKLLNDTVRNTMFSVGRWPKSLSTESDFVEGLIDEAIATTLPLLDSDISDLDLIKTVKSLTRKIIHRERPEHRWYDGSINPKTGNPVRKSKSTTLIVHPVQVEDDGKKEWVGPVDTAESDASGAHVSGPQNVNQTAENRIALIAQEQLIATVVSIIGQADWDWALAYTEQIGGGEPIPAADRKRYQRIREKVKALMPDVEPL